MGHFTFYGTSFNSHFYLFVGNLHVIVEFCEKGSLLHYLRSKRSGDRLNSSHLVTMANQVALGMEYLTSRKVPTSQFIIIVFPNSDLKLYHYNLELHALLEDGKGAYILLKKKNIYIYI